MLHDSLGFNSNTLTLQTEVCQVLFQAKVDYPCSTAQSCKDFRFDIPNALPTIEPFMVIIGYFYFLRPVAGPE